MRTALTVISVVSVLGVGVATVSARGEQAAAQTAPAMTLKVGDMAPDFNLEGTDGKMHKLSDYRGKTAVVVAWFPKAFTSGYIPENERIITIEDAAELQLQQDHVMRMETKVANADGLHAVTIRELVKNSLRMRPDRIVVGEVRGGEALDMLQAMNTGHDGSLTTVHANTPRDAMSRIETLVLMAGMDLPLKVVRQQVSSAVDLIVQQTRLKDGQRKVTAVTEVAGMEGEIIVLTDIFKFVQTGVTTEGKVLGEINATGIRPNFTPRLEAAGFKLTADIFAPKAPSNQGSRR